MTHIFLNNSFYFRKLVLITLKFVVLLTDVTIVNGQPFDILTSTQRNIRIDNSITLLESIEPNTERVVFSPPLKDTVFIPEYKDTIGQFYFSITALGSEINIQYLNDSKWFLFGTRTEYASYPFILKTINSGNINSYFIYM